MQLSFFDHAMKYQGGKKSMKFLNEMKEIIPFDHLIVILVEEGVYTPEVGKKGGRPQTPAKILLGALFLQSWYSLSDPMTEELIHDRISFRKFLDIKDEDSIPDETTICKFRNKLIKKRLLSRIFDEVKEMMIKKKIKRKIKKRAPKIKDMEMSTNLWQKEIIMMSWVFKKTHPLNKLKQHIEN